MSLLGKALGLERRATSTLANPASWLQDGLMADASYSGRSVSVDSSLRLVPVYSAVSLLAGAVGSLPLPVYAKTDDGRERKPNYWGWRLLHDQPNEYMAADELWEVVTGHLLLWGNAFLWKVKGGIYPVAELYPLRPERVQVGIDSQTGERYFIVDGRHRHTTEDILHIRFLGTDGVVGLSPVQQARQMLGTSMDQEEFTGKFYGQGAAMSVVLRHPNRLTPEAIQNLSASLGRKLGPGGTGKPIVLEEGMEVDTLSMPLGDAQFIETARHNLLQTALLFRVPPKMLGAATGDSLTYTSSEWESLDFVRWSLRRILVRIEQSLLRDTDLFPQGRRLYPEFLTEALLRGTTKERYDAYAVALDPGKGWMRREEVRELENLPAEDDPEPESPAVPDYPPIALTGGGS